MKISLCQTIAIVCTLAVGFMTAAPFVQTAEAKWTKKITTIYSYECLLRGVTGDAATCIDLGPWKTIRYRNGWWHKNWNHQDGHKQTREENTKHREETVDGCSECDPPTF